MVKEKKKRKGGREREKEWKAEREGLEGNQKADHFFPSSPHSTLGAFQVQNNSTVATIKFSPMRQVCSFLVSAYVGANLIVQFLPPLYRM